MKMIRLYAYLYHNLGDDLMVEVLLRRYPNLLFYCDSAAPIRNERLIAYPNFIDREQLYERYGRLNHILNIITFHKRENFFFDWLFRRYEQRCSCSVYIGGSLFIPRPGESIDERIHREKKKLQQPPLFIIGANFGEERDEFTRAFEDYFSLCGGVSFRDTTSYEKFSNLSNTQYAPDVVFNYDLRTYALCDNNYVVISVIDLLSRPALSQYVEDYDRLIVDICEECVTQNKTPVMVSFCELEKDPAAISRIYEQLPEWVQKKTQCWYYRNNLSEILDLFTAANYVIATRFHAMVLAMKLHKPFFCISYNEKLRQVLSETGIDHYCEIEQIKTLNPKEILAERKMYISEEYIARAEKQFLQFDKYLDYE